MNLIFSLLLSLQCWGWHQPPTGVCDPTPHIACQQPPPYHHGGHCQFTPIPRPEGWTCQ